MIDEKRLCHQIDRNRKKLEALQARKENLSVHGYQEVGYLEGKLEVLENWLDEMKEAYVSKAIGQQMRVCSFSEVVLGNMARALDEHFDKNGWVLLKTTDDDKDGFQVYFGEGVQVDNSFEFGFPYLYDREEVTGFAEHFYDTRLKNNSLDEKISDAESKRMIGNKGNGMDKDVER